MDKNLRARRISILKPPKIDGRDDDNAKTSRKVRFSSNFVKEFAPATEGEHMTLWDATYEESIEKSSLSSQSQITLASIGDQQQTNKENAEPNEINKFTASSVPPPAKSNIFYPEFCKKIEDPLVKVSESSTYAVPAFVKKAAEKRKQLLKDKSITNSIVTISSNFNDTAAEDLTNKFAAENQNILKPDAISTSPDNVFRIPAPMMGKQNEKRKSFFNSTAIKDGSFFNNDTLSPFADEFENVKDISNKPDYVPITKILNFDSDNGNKHISNEKDEKKTKGFSAGVFVDGEISEHHALGNKCKPDSIAAKQKGSDSSKKSRKTINFNCTMNNADMEMTLQDDDVEKREQNETFFFDNDMDGGGMEESQINFAMNINPGAVIATKNTTSSNNPSEIEMKNRIMKTPSFKPYIDGTNLEKDQIEFSNADHFNKVERSNVLPVMGNMNIGEQKENEKGRKTMHYANFDMEQTEVISSEIIVNNPQKQQQTALRTQTCCNTALDDDFDMEQTRVNAAIDVVQPEIDPKGLDYAKKSQAAAGKRILFGNTDTDETEIAEKEIQVKSSPLNSAKPPDIVLKTNIYRKTQLYDDFDMEQTCLNAQIDVIHSEVDPNRLDRIHHSHGSTNSGRKTVLFGNMDMDETGIATKDIPVKSAPVNRSRNPPEIDLKTDTYRKTQLYDDFDLEQTRLCAPIDLMHREKNQKGLEHLEKIHAPSQKTVLFENMDIDETGVAKNEMHAIASTTINRSATIHYDNFDMEQSSVFSSKVIDNALKKSPESVLKARTCRKTQLYDDFDIEQTRLHAPVDLIHTEVDKERLDTSNAPTDSSQKTVLFGNMDMDETGLAEKEINVKSALINCSASVHFDNIAMGQTNVFSSEIVDNSRQNPSENTLKVQTYRKTQLYDDFDMEQTRIIAPVYEIHIDIDPEQLDLIKTNQTQTNSSRKTIMFANMDMDETGIAEKEMPFKSNDSRQNPPENVLKAETQVYDDLYMEHTRINASVEIMHSETGLKGINQIKKNQPSSKNNRKTILFANMDIDETGIAEKEIHLKTSPINRSATSQLDNVNLEENPPENTEKAESYRKTQLYDDFDMEQTRVTAPVDVNHSELDAKDLSRLKTSHALSKSSRKTVLFGNMDMNETRIAGNGIHVKPSPPNRSVTINYDNDSMEQTNVFSSGIVDNNPQQNPPETASNDDTNRKTQLYDDLMMQQTGVTAPVDVIHSEIDTKELDRLKKSHAPSKSNRKTVLFGNMDIDQAEIARKDIHDQSTPKKHSENPLEKGLKAETYTKTQLYDDFDMEQTRVNDLIHSEKDQKGLDYIEPSRKTVLFENMDMDETAVANNEMHVKSTSIYRSKIVDNAWQNEPERVFKARTSRKTQLYDDFDMEQTRLHVPVDLIHTEVVKERLDKSTAPTDGSQKTVLFGNMDMDETRKAGKDIHVKSTPNRSAIIHYDNDNNSQQNPQGNILTETCRNRYTKIYDDFDVEETRIDVIQNKIETKKLDHRIKSSTRKILDMDETGIAGKEIYLKSTPINRSVTMHDDNADMERISVFSSGIIDNNLRQNPPENVLKTHTYRKTQLFDDFDMEQTRVNASENVIHCNVDDRSFNQKKENQKSAGVNRRTVIFGNMDMDVTGIKNDVETVITRTNTHDGTSQIIEAQTEGSQAKNEYQSMNPQTIIFSDMDIGQTSIAEKQRKSTNVEQLEMEETHIIEKQIEGKRHILSEATNRRTTAFPGMDTNQTGIAGNLGTSILEKSLKSQTNTKNIQCDDMKMDEPHLSSYEWKEEVKNDKTFKMSMVTESRTRTVVVMDKNETMLGKETHIQKSAMARPLNTEEIPTCVQKTISNNITMRSKNKIIIHDALAETNNTGERQKNTCCGDEQAAFSNQTSNERIPQKETNTEKKPSPFQTKEISTLQTESRNIELMRSNTETIIDGTNNFDPERPILRAILKKSETFERSNMIVDDDGNHAKYESPQGNLTSSNINQNAVYDISSDLDVTPVQDEQKENNIEHVELFKTSETEKDDSIIAIIDTSNPLLFTPKGEKVLEHPVSDLFIGIRRKAFQNQESTNIRPSMALHKRSFALIPDDSLQTTGGDTGVKRDLSQCGPSPLLLAKRFDDKCTPLKAVPKNRPERSAKRNLMQSPSSSKGMPLKKVDDKATPKKINERADQYSDFDDSVRTTHDANVEASEKKYQLYCKCLEQVDEVVSSERVEKITDDFTPSGEIFTSDTDRSNSEYLKKEIQILVDSESIVRDYFDAVQRRMCAIAEENELLLSEDWQPPNINLTLMDKIQKKAKTHSEYKIQKLGEDFVNLKLKLEEYEIAVQFKPDTGCVDSFDIDETCRENPNSFSRYTYHFYKLVLDPPRICALIGRQFSILTLMDYFECQLTEFGETLMSVFFSMIEFNTKVVEPLTLTYKHLTSNIEVTITLDLMELNMEKIPVKAQVHEGLISTKKLEGIVASIRRDRNFPRNVIAAIHEYLQNFKTYVGYS